MRAARIRDARPADLDDVNAVIEAAVMHWDLPERVKRLSLPLLQYDRYDMDAYTVRVVEMPDGRLAGVAAWTEADPLDLPPGTRGLLLHGIYLLPALQRQGVGSLLFAEARKAAGRLGANGLLVKAQAGAEGFFVRQGMTKLPVVDPDRDYPRRYWLSFS